MQPYTVIMVPKILTVEFMTPFIAFLLLFLVFMAVDVVDYKNEIVCIYLRLAYIAIIFSLLVIIRCFIAPIFA